MSLKDWSDNGWLKPHRTDRQEIANLLSIVERDIADAEVSELSADWRFGIAYNAALKLCTIVLYVQGYRPENNLAHFRTILSLKEMNGRNWESYTTYLNACRMRRNAWEYDRVGVIAMEDATVLLTFARTFHGEVREYLAQFFPDFL
ncbi:MAG: hypothetical protein IKS92_13435 [Victivallales bacterium]|nr:hypothetical protein [Victivallales bacterium]